MSKNDKRNEEPEEETPKVPPPEPEFPENDLFTEGVEEPEHTKDKEE